DSGCSHAAVLETRPELRWPAELYLEGSDQHRGWFHSSLLEAIATGGAPPYESVLTCGFVVDGEGRKMSKSVGNTVAPEDLIPKYGAEVLRLWVAAEGYTEDIRVSAEILDRLADAYRRIRNTFRFLLGNLSAFDPARDRQSSARLDETDRWIRERPGRLVGRVTRALETARAQGLIGSGLEARLRVAAAPEDLPELLRAKRALLPTLFIVSQVELGGARTSAAVQYESQEIPGLVIGVDKARGRKCQRC